MQPFLSHVGREGVQTAISLDWLLHVEHSTLLNAEYCMLHGEYSTLLRTQILNNKKLNAALHNQIPHIQILHIQILVDRCRMLHSES